MEKQTKEKTDVKKYSKPAFVEAAESTKDSIVLQVVLEDGQTYSKADVEKAVKKWKEQKVDPEKEKEVKK